MLGNAFFTHRTLRKVVVAFGTVFNDLQVVRFNKARTQFHTTNVPLVYAPKEKYITRILSDPDLTKSINLTLPRMSFNLDGISYDPSRKQLTTLNNFQYSTEEGLKTQYAPVPYNFDFTLSIYVRNVEDGTQIVEQILPFFSPDFTVVVDFNPEMNRTYNMPILLNSVTTEVDYEGDLSTTRLIIWDLSFTAKGFIFPPVTSNAPGLIGMWSDVGGPDGQGGYGGAYINIYTDNRTKEAQEVYVDVANGFGTFAISEMFTVVNKTTKGKIIYYANNSTGLLVAGELTQLLEPNDIIIGNYTNAKYTVLSSKDAPTKNVMIIVKPDPEDAEPDDDYGYSESIIEYG
jgi:hypothetical protein